MNVSDLVYIDSTGYHYADYPTFLQWVQDQYRAIYGADIYLGADSQDGQRTAVEAQAMYDLATRGAAVYNSFSPTTAVGVGLSRVVKINGLKRNIPTNSTVVLTVVGVAGTTITNGIASDTLGQQWLLPASVSIPGGGSVNVTATAKDVGAVNAAANTVTGIFTPTLGWQTVNNASAATSGAAVEADSALRIRQSLSTSLPALTVLQATTSALANLAGVSAVQPYENTSESTDGNGLPPHSVCFVVQGGSISDITNTIGRYKTPGTDTFATGTNSNSETYNDPAGLPVPINFYSPAITATIGVQITVHALTSAWDTSFEAPIAQAVAALVESYGIGGTILYTALIGAVYSAPAYNGVDPIQGSFYVVSLQIKKNAGSYAAANITVNFNEIPVCDPTLNVTFIVA